MLTTLPGQALRFVASIAVIVLLATHPAAAAAQKPTAPSPTSQAQLEARVKDLETRLAAAEQKADKATMETEYILRTQNHYEAYYKEVFSTQTHILWTIGVTVTLIALTFSVVFFVAGRFGFNIFDRRIEATLRDATAQLRTEFAERLANEMKALQEAHGAELKVLEDDLTKRITEQEHDLRTRSQYQFQFAQGLGFFANENWNQAANHFRRALVIYKSSKELFGKDEGAVAARNIFVALKRQGKTEESIKTELSDELYNDLEDELARVALDLAWFRPLLKERKFGPTPNVVAPPKTGEAKQNEPPPAAPPSDEE
jgi:hypothetical protein